GIFCGMGVCFDCIVTVSGKGRVQACMTAVEPGLRVELGDGLSRSGGGGGGSPVPHPHPPPGRKTGGEKGNTHGTIRAGPAGPPAAAEATHAGAEVAVIDQYGWPGGQFFRPLRHGRGDAGRVARRSRVVKHRLLEEIDQSRVRYLYGTTVWGIFANDVL